MVINGKEIGFLYNVGAFCDYTDWCVANPKASVASAELVKTEYMSRAFAKVNGIDNFITVAELRDLMPYELADILANVKKAEQEGSKRQIDTEDVPKKKGESS